MPWDRNTEEMETLKLLSAAALAAAVFLSPLAQAAPFELQKAAALKNINVREFILKAGKKDFPSVQIKYPVFTNKAVDEKILGFITFYSGNYLKSVNDVAKELKDDLPSGFSSWEMTGDYGLSSPSKNFVSITFEFYSYTGGAHGNIDIDTVNLDLRNGKELDLDDLFKEPATALKIMSEYSYKELKKSIKQNLVEDMLKAGTEPKKINFDNLELLPQGLRVVFSPYQVAPWSEGIQTVVIPLKVLKQAGPSAAIWPKQSGKRK